MALRFCELPVVVASSPAAAREIMRTHDATFASRPIGPMMQLVFQGSPGVIFAPYGEGWRQLRRICALELLSARRVHSFRPVREHELGGLLRSIAAAAAAVTPVNLAEQLKAFIADSMVRAIVDSRSEHHDACQKRTHTGTARNAGDLLRRALNGTEGEEHSHTRTQRRNTDKGIFVLRKRIAAFLLFISFYYASTENGRAPAMPNFTQRRVHPHARFMRHGRVSRSWAELFSRHSIYAHGCPQSGARAHAELLTETC
jgi:hypothetical protein